MNNKFKKKHIQIIKPVIKKCFICKKKVKNHHFLCDSCISERDKKKYRKKRNLYKLKQTN